MEAPPTNKARLIIFRESSIGGVARFPTIQVNGRPVCDLPNASFFSVDVHPGEAFISSESWDLPGVSSASFVVEPGSLTYVRFRWESSRLIGGTIGGLIGYWAGAELSATKGPFVFETVEKMGAVESLKSLRGVACP